MSKILEIFQGHTTYMVIGLYVIIGAIVITLVLHLISGRLRFIKYLPGLVLLFIGVFTLFTVINALFDPESIKAIVIAVLGISSGIISLLFAIILGIIYNALRGH